MVVEISNNLNTAHLHVYHGYTTCFLPVRAAPLLRTALQPTFEHISVTFIENLVAFPCGDALHQIFAWNDQTIMRMKFAERTTKTSEH